MSRSGYGCGGDGEEYPIAFWRQAVNRAIAGKRGQAFLREMGAALDAMPVKELIWGELVTHEGFVCALGAVAVARNIDVTEIDIEDGDSVGNAFGIASALAREIVYENDERAPEWRSEPPAERWQRMRAWVSLHTRGT